MKNLTTLLLVNLVSLLCLNFLFLGSKAFANQNVCNNTPNQLSANYTIETLSRSGQSEQHSHQTLVLWRKDNLVGHQFPEKDITELWEYQKNQRIKLYREFDAHQRGIEYTSEEIKSEHINWDNKYQLLPNTVFKQLNKTKTEKESCWTVEYYSSAPQNKVVTKLQWIPELKLIKSLELSGESGSKTWSLKKVDQNAKTVNSAFAAWDKYQLTDYADVGDNESDPFLMKMINLGFIEHGASGFYNDKGEQLGGGHHH